MIGSQKSEIDAKIGVLSGRFPDPVRQTRLKPPCIRLTNRVKTHETSQIEIANRQTDIDHVLAAAGRRLKISTYG